jgi:hypothetical protein
MGATKGASMTGQPSHDKGLVTNLKVTEYPELPNTYMLVFYPEDNERAMLLITEGVAQSMWSKLTKILYPRAAGQLTQRIRTVKNSGSRLPWVITIVQLFVRGEDALIQLNGVSRMEEWHFTFTQEEGDHLWVSLEGLFRNVEGGGE